MEKEQIAPPVELDPKNSNEKRERGDEDICHYLTNWLAREIPISQSLELKPLSWVQEKLTIAVPLAPNRNHMGTGFGGSLYTASLLVAWSWLHLKLRELGISEKIHIVIQDAHIHYPMPMKEDAIAICEASSDEPWARFVKMFHRYGKGRIKLESHLESAGIITTQFKGDFVVYRT
ncbi:thioesterase [Ignatzschineria indica]|uniref:Thioesterase n=1 Tax=Ignatzschineria indica TaxID=472583 RepID=A0A2U2AN38_9GAMM|nr:YiiD C-terminal domain-containing protein [Ignatzschineria indica]PWD84633.1 thioesterase [Ignatzschineria indica]GGZ77955.1 thioesterase [Ignatzschineria indica]